MRSRLYRRRSRCMGETTAGVIVARKYASGGGGLARGSWFRQDRPARHPDASPGPRAPQRQPHGRAGAARAFIGRDLAVLSAGQLTDDVEAEADPAEPAPVPGLRLYEPVKDPLPVFRPDSDALVLDRDLDPAVNLPGPDGDRAAL